MDRLSPKNHAEEVAIFRHGLIGELASSELDHGALVEGLRRLSEQRVRPPGSDITRTYSITTYERWLYAFKGGGLDALIPRARSDRGRGLGLDPELRALLLDIRREHADISVPLILRTLRADGRIGPEVTACTVRSHVRRARALPQGHRREHGRKDPPALAGHPPGCALAR
ncbi:MAG: helix-turn-helix domain-containing protein [Byssovorax sp.]